MNKLLNKFDFIPYGEFSLEELEQAITETLNIAQNTLTAVLTEQIKTWQTIEPLHHSIYKFNRLWGTLNHLMSVTDTQPIRKLYEKLQPQITDFFVNLGQNKALYEHYNSIKQNSYNTLGLEQQKVLDNEFRDFYLSGINLNPQEQVNFKQIQNELEQLSTTFAQNVLDATDVFVKYVTKNEIEGIPEDIASMYHEAALKDGKEGLYKITLHMPSYLPIMQYCNNRQLRQELYKEYVTRASEFGDIKFNNSSLINKILGLRDDKATLLGFSNYCELSLYTKMAENPNQVLDFLYKLAEKSKPYALNDLAELSKLAQDKFGIVTLEAWDIAFFSEKLQQQKYSYSNHELKQYFQLPIVLDGLFILIKNLYQIEFKPNLNAPTWHTDVIVFDVIHNNAVIGTLFLDLYSRNGKLQGAWMNSAQDKYVIDNDNYKPIAYIICNFTAPSSSNVTSLLTLDEVQTLFHEMGHSLHHLLTKITNYSISGINGVEWDAVELPSQFMEYFTWSYDILKGISKHIETNQVLPIELYHKLLASKNYQAGLQMLRQLEFAIYDILLHCENNPVNINYMHLLDKLRQDIAVINPPKYNRFPNSFTHIFAGGYASGYYSYKWAEVLATDIFSVFDNQPINMLSQLGNKFAQTILSQGGLNPMMDNFKNFLGREPDINALLDYSFGKNLSHD